MQIRNTASRYGAVAKLFHWSVFLLISGLIYVGFTMEGLPSSPDKFWLYEIHKSTGILVLFLVMLRLFWKWYNVKPMFPSSLGIWEKRMAHAGHSLLYILMIAMPLSGWVVSSAAGYPVQFFGLFALPDIVEADPELLDVSKAIHFILAWSIVVVVTLHVTAALLHHFYHKNIILRRMLPEWRKK